LRRAAYDELVERGRDVSGSIWIQVLGKQNALFGNWWGLWVCYSDATMVPSAIWIKVKLIFPDGDIDYKKRQIDKECFNNLYLLSQTYQIR
jgi:hypothetical protein